MFFIDLCKFFISFEISSNCCGSIRFDQILIAKLDFQKCFRWKFLTYSGHISYQKPIRGKPHYSNENKHLDCAKIQNIYLKLTSDDIAIANAIISKPASIFRIFFNLTTPIRRFDRLRATSNLFWSSKDEEVWFGFWW